MIRFALPALFSLAATLLMAAEPEYGAVRNLKSRGVVKCADAMAAAIKTVFHEPGFAAANTIHSKDPDRHVMRTLGSLPISDGALVAVIEGGPLDDGQCETSTIQVSAAPVACDVVRERVFEKWTRAGKLGKHEIYRYGEERLVALLASPPGCVAVGLRVVLSGSPEMTTEKGNYSAVKRCGAAIAGATKIMHSDEAIERLELTHKKDADKHLAILLAATNDADDPSVTIYAGTPAEAGACDLSYTRIFSVRESCEDFRARGFGKYSREGELANTTVFVAANTGGAMRAALTPVGRGCLVVWMIKEYDLK